jgi:hypothetical protein
MRRLLTLLLVLALTQATAQVNRRGGDPFLRSQWYLGFYGGGNFSKSIPTQTYSVLAELQGQQAETSKEHSGFTQMGTQAGLIFQYSSNGFNIAINPGIHSLNIQHSTASQWLDTNNPDNTVDINYTHKTRLNYLEIPLSLHYDILKEKLRPYIGIGGYYGVLINASRTIERSGTDSASGNAGSFTDQPVTIGVKDLYISSSVGVFGHLGVSYDPGNIRLFVDLGYKFGLNNITNSENRYVNNDLASIGEAMDDITVHSFYFTTGVCFPLKFISKNYNSF